MRATILCLVSIFVGGTSVLARDPTQVLMPTDPSALALQTQYGFADAVMAGDKVYLSGVMAIPMSGEKSVQPAYDRAFKQIDATLARAGLSWDDVVDLSTFHTNLSAQIYEFAAVKAKFVKAPFPAWTAVGITSLVDPAAVTEIKVIARKSGK